VFMTVAAFAGRSDLIRFGARPASEDDTFAVAGDPTLLRERGWEPKWGLPEGLADTVDWWRRQLAQESGGTT
ncbi:MAG: NAD-dependent epimerase/dehydratase family protein, partial [Gemmatimonadales bacterium]